MKSENRLSLARSLSLDRNVALYQADCMQFLRALPDESVDIIVTDPAYSGMNVKMSFGNGRIVGRYNAKNNDKWFQDFHDDIDTYRIFLRECRRVLKNNRHIYIMFDSYSLLTLGSVVRDIFDVKNVITWDKINMGMGHYFRRRHEFIIFATKGYRKLAQRDLPDVWRFKRISRGIYPTQKPVEVFEAMLKGSVRSGYVVCDPFMGSGSAIIAALRKGCRFVGADISKRACRISRDRTKHYVKTGMDKFQKSSTVV